jgi:hypothetical protein
MGAKKRRVLRWQNWKKCTNTKLFEKKTSKRVAYEIWINQKFCILDSSIDLLKKKGFMFYFVKKYEVVTPTNTTKSWDTIPVI